MTAADDRAIERMRKLLALARQGVGGEAANAERFLQSMLRRHGMTMADLVDDEQPRRWVEFRYHGDFEQELLVCIICKVLNAGSFSSRRTKGTRNRFEVELTRAQEVEVRLMRDVYRPALEKALKHATAAFILLNDITADAPADENRPAAPPMSPEDIAAIRSMMGGMQPTPVHKAINHTAG